MSEYLTSAEEKVKEFQPRFRLLYLTIGIMVALFFSRLWYLQIFKGNELRLFSEKNRIKEEKILAPRGMILDREGRVLVDNLPGFDVTITPQYAHELEKTAERVGQILEMDPKDVVRKVKQGRKQYGTFRPVRIKEHLTRDEVSRIERVRFAHAGLDIKMSIKRTYMIKDNGAQLFGYVGEISKQELPKLNRNRVADQQFRQGDIIGKSGIEQYYDKILRGKDGLQYDQVDAFGRAAEIEAPEVLKSLDQFQDAQPGNSLVLTLDQDIQSAAYDAFLGTERIGALVAISNKTGRILAWVNSPSFDPTKFSTGISPKLWDELVNDPFKPLRNKAIQDHHAPGSTFKAVMALAALEEKVITTSSTQYCPGFLKFGRRVYHCHSRGGHGNVNVLKALEVSCNIFFYKMGIALGIDRISKYAKALGIGVKTNVALGNEVPGLMPTEKWKKKRFGEAWQPGESLSNAIGQGFVLTTPLQLATVFSGIANGGPIYKPYFVDKIIDVNGSVVKELQPEIVRDPSTKTNTEVKISKKNYDIVKKGLWKVANGDRGTARWYKIPGVEISGKSGTTQIYNLAPDQVYVKCKTRPINMRHHGWFVGYAPYEDPEITVAVLAEHSCSGSGGGAPVVRDVIRAYFEKYHPEKIQKKKKRVAKAEEKKTDE